MITVNINRKCLDTHKKHVGIDRMGYGFEEGDFVEAYYEKKDETLLDKSLKKNFEYYLSKMKENNDHPTK